MAVYPTAQDLSPSSSQLLTPRLPTMRPSSSSLKRLVTAAATARSDAIIDPAWVTFNAASPEICTRRLTMTNAYPNAALLLAISAAPHLPGAFGVRCDHSGLVCHPGKEGAAAAAAAT